MDNRLSSFTRTHTRTTAQQSTLSSASSIMYFFSVASRRNRSIVLCLLFFFCASCFALYRLHLLLSEFGVFCFIFVEKVTNRFRCAFQYVSAVYRSKLPQPNTSAQSKAELYRSNMFSYSFRAQINRGALTGAACALLHRQTCDWHVCNLSPEFHQSHSICCGSTTKTRVCVEQSQQANRHFERIRMEYEHKAKHNTHTTNKIKHTKPNQAKPNHTISEQCKAKLSMCTAYPLFHRTFARSFAYPHTHKHTHSSPDTHANLTRVYCSVVVWSKFPQNDHF